MKTCWDVEVQLLAFLTSALDGSEWSAWRRDRFTPGAHCIGGWVGPRAGLDAVPRRKIPSTQREPNPRRPARSLVTIQDTPYVNTIAWSCFLSYNSHIIARKSCPLGCWCCSLLCTCTHVKGVLDGHYHCLRKGWRAWYKFPSANIFVARFQATVGEWWQLNDAHISLRLNFVLSLILVGGELTPCILRYTWVFSDV